jgi:hypothetical protein
MTENLNIEYHTKKAVIKAMRITKNNVEAAKILGLPPRTLSRKIKDYGLNNFKRTVIPLKEIDGHVILCGQPSQKLIEALNKMAELAFNNL